MIVSDFTKPEIEYLIDNCNFVNDEIKVFKLRSQGVGLEEIAERLNLTYNGAKRISRKVSKKILRVL